MKHFIYKILVASFMLGFMPNLLYGGNTLCDTCFGKKKCSIVGTWNISFERPSTTGIISYTGTISFTEDCLVDLETTAAPRATIFTRMQGIWRQDCEGGYQIFLVDSFVVPSGAFSLSATIKLTNDCKGAQITEGTVGLLVSSGCDFAYDSVEDISNSELCRLSFRECL